MSKYGIVTVSCSGGVGVFDLDSKELDLQLLKKLVHGYIEIVNPLLLETTNPYLRMIVNEEGKLLDLPVNALGSAIYGNPDDAIVGDIVFATCFNEDPEAEPDVYALKSEDAYFLAEFFKRLVDDLKDHHFIK